MDEITINCRIVAIHPFFDEHRNEFVCIKFGVESSKPPTVVSMPTNVSKEVASIMPLLTQIPKMMSKPNVYNNRLILFLTKPEWNSLTRKYQYHDEVDIKISKDGTIQLAHI